ncbi:MAG TPA: hypothetical protein VKD04_03625 [Burkholderiales bacterium]|nr:hypothetical protein [Burkholderiales bacterium]
MNEFNFVRQFDDDPAGKAGRMRRIGNNAKAGNPSGDGSYAPCTEQPDDGDWQVNGTESAHGQNVTTIAVARKTGRRIPTCYELASDGSVRNLKHSAFWSNQ